MIKVDLHVHSKFSDGDLDISEIMTRCSIAGIKEISITDHDTIINLRKYLLSEYNKNLRIISGIEIPVDYPGMHILGYGITNFDKVENYLYNLKKYNEYQNIQTIKALKSNGINIDIDEIRTQSISDIISYRDIVEYLLRHNYITKKLDAYEKYIGKGTIAYFPSQKAKVKEVLQLIDSSNGISVLAHPFTLNKTSNFDRLIFKLKEYGLSGLECLSPKILKEQELFYTSIAKKYNLVRTAGTDFHDSNVDILGIEVSNNYLDDFHDKVLRK